MSENQMTADELTVLKERADRLGVAYHPSIGLEKLREKVNAVMADKPPVVEAALKATMEVAAALSAEDLANQKRMQLRNEQLALVRIQLACMNPIKAEWEGEIFTVGNSLVGTITKYVPFNAPDGWHVPQILLDTLQDRQCQIFTTVKSKNGVSVRQGKLIKEFSIQILPPLTQEELHDLAQRQAMAGAVD
jgi:hypothetical protein